MTGSWQPLGVRQGWRVADSMIDGVPDWMSVPVWAWISRVVRGVPETSRSDVVEQLGLQLHLSLEAKYLPDSQLRQAVNVERFLSASAGLDPTAERTLEIADWLLHMHASVGVAVWQQESAWMAGAPTQLEGVLSSGGSRWRVSSGGDRLEDRVDQTVVDAADEAIAAAAQSAPSAAEHLRSAWSAMYGRTPNHKDAVVQAILAVEAATKPLVLGTNHGTLSDVLRELDEDGRWELAMPLEWGKPPKTTTTDGGKVLSAMVKIVWHGQGERHGSPTSADPMPPGQAETVLTAAVALVHLFSAALVRPVTSTP